MQSFMMLALGAYRFSVYGAGYEEFTRETAWRWESQQVIGGRPAKQFLGPGEETIQIRGTIYTHYRGGLGQVSAMRAEAGLGIPLVLVDGTGQYYGDYVVDQVTEGKTVFMADGAPRKIEFSLKLSRFG